VYTTLYIMTNIAAHKHKRCWMMLEMNFMETKVCPTWVDK